MSDSVELVISGGTIVDGTGAPPRAGTVIVEKDRMRELPAAAEPPDDPPGTSGVFEPLRRHGDTTGPSAEVSFEEPIANSSLLVLPSITAPSRQSCAVTVDS